MAGCRRAWILIESPTCRAAKGALPTSISYKSTPTRGCRCGVYVCEYHPRWDTARCTPLRRGILRGLVLKDSPAFEPQSNCHRMTITEVLCEACAHINIRAIAISESRALPSLLKSRARQLAAHPEAHRHARTKSSLRPVRMLLEPFALPCELQKQHAEFPEATSDLVQEGGFQRGPESQVFPPQSGRRDVKHKARESRPGSCCCVTDRRCPQRETTEHRWQREECTASDFTRALMSGMTCIVTRCGRVGH